MAEHHCNNPGCSIDGVSASNEAQSEFYRENDRTIPAGPGPIFKVTATIELSFDSEDGLVTSVAEAEQEMIEYLSTGPFPSEFTICIDTE